MNRREAVRSLAGGSAFGLLAGALVSIPSYTFAPALAETASTDPCLAFVGGWNAVSKQCAAIRNEEVDAFYKERCLPFEKTAAFGTVPAATTAAGAAAALEKVIAFGDLERQDENLIRAALAYLEARTGGHA